MDRMILLLAAVLLLGGVAHGAEARPAAAPKVLVTLDRSGGFAGIERRVVVYRTGKVVTTERGKRSTTTWTAARMRTLRIALEQSRWATLRARYAPQYPLADGYVYRISYTGRTIRIDEDAKLPPRLDRVFRLLASGAGTLG